MVNALDLIHLDSLIPSVKKVEKDVSLHKASHVALGLFYEMMTGGFYGGINVYENSQSNIVDLYPDVVDPDREIIYDSKAHRSGHSLNLYDEQITRYKDFHRQNPNYDIYFVCYQHDFPKIKSFNGTIEELFDRLASDKKERTSFSIVFPFSIILKLFILGKNREEEPFIGRYEQKPNGTFWSCSRVYSSTLKRFFWEPWRIIEGLGLNSNNYSLERVKSPEEFCINGHRIEQFPILLIHDKKFEE